MRNDPWAFDDSVARRFADEARMHIPHYEEVVGKCVHIAERAFPDRQETRIIDVGSALGHTLKAFRAAGYRQVYGVDSSQAMLERSIVTEGLVHSTEFPSELAPFHLVVANWTLHFVKQRKRYLRRIAESLHDDGMLVITDKMRSSAFVHEHYIDFKRRAGVSEAYIAEKTEQLKGVLVPLSREWYLATLADVGFKHVEIIDASWCFMTLLCSKRRIR